MPHYVISAALWEKSSSAHGWLGMETAEMGSICSEILQVG